MVIRQRTHGSCGIAALSVLQIDAVMRRIDPVMRGLDGLYHRELIDAAQNPAPIALRPVSNGKYDLDTDTGLLRVRWRKGQRKKDSPGGHFVAMIEGIIYCSSEHVAMPWREYLLQFDAEATTLLKVVR